MDISIFVALLVLGCGVGFMAGLLGIGGGLITVPILTMLLLSLNLGDVAVHMAVATASATIVFTSIASAFSHYVHKAILWEVWKPMTPGLLIGGVIGAQIAGLLPKVPLAICFVLFTFFSSAKMLFGGNPRPNHQLPGRLTLGGVGTLIGTISSLIGAGGGFISVPYMVWNNISIRNAVATSAAMGVPIALASTVGYIYSGMGVAGRPEWSLGYVYLPAVLAIVITSMSFAPLGARAAHTWNVGVIRKCFAVLLCVLGASMLWRVVQQ